MSTVKEANDLIMRLMPFISPEEAPGIWKSTEHGIRIGIGALREIVELLELHAVPDDMVPEALR